MPTILGPQEMLPAKMEGPVISGFGRGSSLLGFPTANIPPEPYDKILPDFPLGVYYGWATINRKGPAYRMAMSIGLNPFFHNEKKTIEVHILHKFTENFYGAHLKIIVVGFLRNMVNFPSLDTLKAAIADDCRRADEELSSPETSKMQEDPFLFAQ